MRLFDDGLLLWNKVVPLRGEAAEAMGLVLTQARHSLHCGWELAFVGYPVQALSTCRLAAEYLIAAWYIERHPEEARRWTTIEGKPPKPAGELLKKLEKEKVPAIEHLGRMRTYLHRFAHQDNLSLSALFIESIGEKPIVQIGPNPNLAALKLIAFYLAMITSLCLNQARGQIPTTETKWHSEARAYLERILNWLDASWPREPESETSYFPRKKTPTSTGGP